MQCSFADGLRHMPAMCRRRTANERVAVLRCGKGARLPAQKTGGMQLQHDTLEMKMLMGYKVTL
jgi:hypothetical protein